MTLSRWLTVCLAVALAIALLVPGASAQATVYGNGCSGLNPEPQIWFTGSTSPGGYCVVHLAGAPPGGLVLCLLGFDNDFVGAEPVPWDVSHIPGVNGGCALWHSDDFINLFLNADGNGEIHMSFPVPLNIGDDLYVQWAVVEAFGPNSVTLSQALSLEFTAVPTPDVPSLAFAPEYVGETSVEQVVRFTNDTDATMTVDDVIVVGDRTGDFNAVIKSATPAVLDPSEFVDVGVTFQPNSPGQHDAFVRLVQSAVPPDWTPAQVDVSGIAWHAPGVEYLLNCGGPELVDSLGQTFTADFGYTRGQTDSSGVLVGGTPDPELYATLRGAASFGYDLAVPNGEYLVTLRFAESRVNGPGLRVFDVTLEGGLAADDLDIFAAVGKDIAHDLTFPVTVADGSLDIDFAASVSTAQVNALEVRRQVPVLDVDLPSLDFGTLGQGAQATLPLQLTNVGSVPLTVTDLDFLIGPGGGAGHEFIVDIAGAPYSGGETDANVVLAPPLVLAPTSGAQVDVTFAPTEHMSNEVLLAFNGDFGSQQVTLLGVGGSPGDPFLHVVIVVDPIVVDYDGSGDESVRLDGSDSHTHEPGVNLSAWQWTEGGSPISAAAVANVVFPVGPHDVCLEIFDDDVPQGTLQDCASFEVYAPDEIPGVLALYYYGGVGQAPEPLLDAVPANASWAEIRGQLRVDEEGGIGGSPFSESVMVRLQAGLAVPSTASYEFSAVGGSDSRLLIDGAPYAGPLLLGAGVHAVEARFAVPDLGDLPVEVLFGPEGGRLLPILPSELTYDALQDRPVINTMPTAGITLGGDQIVIEGFGYFPDDQVTVHWGASTFDLGDFTSLEDDRIEFFSPPHAEGVVAVYVETPSGTSNVVNYTYDEAATPPISFTMTTPVSVTTPTTGEWGPDGRFWVGKRNGELLAITFDDAYAVVAQQTYPGVSGLSNHEILGLGFNPFDPPSPLRVYVSHNELYAHGGGNFTGPSPYPGQISILQGPDFDTPIPLVTGLPASNHDHAINGFQFDNNGDLLVGSGSNTNAGIPTTAHGTLPESPLSAAVLKAELSKPGFNGAVTYVETVGGAPNDDQVFGGIVDVAPGVDVHVHAPGFRNVFDMVYTTWGMLYGVDNGPNVSFGPGSLTCSTQTASGAASADEFNLIEYGNYYGAPNRNRGRYDERQCTWQHISNPSIPGVFTQHLWQVSSSTNGILEYRSTAFAGQLYGDLMMEKWNNPVKRVELSGDRRDVLSVTTISPNLSALDIALGPGGAIIGVDYSSSVVSVLRPNDVSVGAGMVAWDVFPWRAPATGGIPFIIGGKNFDVIATTSVTFGGLPATITSVSAERIEGIVPAQPSPSTAMLNVVVNSGGEQSVLPAAFRYLFVPAGNEPGRWEVRADMPTQVGEIAAGVIDGKLYVVGESTTKTQRYDIAADSWIDTLAVRPFAGHHHAAETWGGKLYLIGGLTNGAPGKVQIYDPVTNSWSLGAAMPWNGGSVSTCLIGDSIYAAGGIVGSTTVDNCARYDPALDTWTPLASVPSGLGRNHAASGTDGERFYVFGGRGIGSGASNVVANGFDSVQVYDPLTNAWITSDDAGPPGSLLAPLPQFRGGMGHAIWYQDEFYVFGGETLDGPGATPQKTYRRVDVYDPAANTWRLEAQMPTARHGIYPVLYESRMFVVAGGTSSGFSKSAKVEIFTRQ